MEDQPSGRVGGLESENQIIQVGVGIVKGLGVRLRLFPSYIAFTRRAFANYNYPTQSI